MVSEVGFKRESEPFSPGTTTVSGFTDSLGFPLTISVNGVAEPSTETAVAAVVAEPSTGAAVAECIVLK